MIKEIEKKGVGGLDDKWKRQNGWEIEIKEPYSINVTEYSFIIRRDFPLSINSLSVS